MYTSLRTWSYSVPHKNTSTVNLCSLLTPVRIGVKVAISPSGTLCCQTCSSLWLQLWQLRLRLLLQELALGGCQGKPHHLPCSHTHSISGSLPAQVLQGFVSLLSGHTEAHHIQVPRTRGSRVNCYMYEDRHWAISDPIRAQFFCWLHPEQNIWWEGRVHGKSQPSPTAGVPISENSLVRL